MNKRKLANGVITGFLCAGVLLMTTGQPARAGLPAWVENAKFGGNLNLRYESLSPDHQPGNQLSRDRYRYLLKYGVVLDPDPQVRLGLSLASNGFSGAAWASSDVRAQNVTMDDSGKDDPLFIDEIWATYTPDWKATNWLGLSATGGKVKNPFQTDRFLFAGGWTPEGFYGQLAPPSLAKYHVSYVGGAFMMEEIADAMTETVGGFSPGKDGYMLGNQIRFGIDKVGPFDLGFWASHYHFVRPTLSLSTVAGTSQLGFGNNSTAGNRLASEFGLMDFGATVTTMVVKRPLVLGFQYTSNESARPDPASANTMNDEAWSAMVKFGAVKKQYDWEVSAHWANIEADAMIAALIDSDFGASEGGTNYEGLRANIGFGVTDSSKLGVTYYDNSPILGTRGDPDVQVLQVDYLIKF